MKLFILLITSTFLSTCATSKKTAINTTIFGKELKVIELNGNNISDLDLTLTFQKDKKKITGFSGCNNYFGTYFLDRDKVAFSKIGATKIYCSTNNIDKNEKLFLSLLTSITNYNLTDISNIEFLNKNKNVIIILEF